MATDKEVIREFLVSLGFQVEQPGLRKFKDSLESVSKFALFASKSVAGVAIAAEAMVTIFANQMEKMYYASKISGASVKNLQSLEYGAQQIGLTAGTLTQALKSMALTMKMNPGIQGFVQSLGITVSGRDMGDVAMDVLKATKALPFYQGAGIMQQYFGMDPETYQLITENLDKLSNKQQEYIELLKTMGIDSDKAAADAVELGNAQSHVLAILGSIKDLAAIKMLPWFKDFSNGIVELLPYLDDMFNKVGKVYIGLKGFAEMAIALAHGDWAGIKRAASDSGLAISKDSIGDRNRMYAQSAAANKAAIDNDIGSQKNGATDLTAPSATMLAKSPPSTAPTSFAELEARYGLPAGLLDKMYYQESRRNPKAYNKRTGAAGGFQFMESTAKQYGVTDRYDLGQESVGAAAYMADLLKKYGGHLDQALAAYNYGPGNLDKKGMNHLPKETRDYVADILGNKGGTTISQHTEIIVNSSGDPHSTAKAVAREQTRVIGDAIRNTAGALS